MSGIGREEYERRLQAALRLVNVVELDQIEDAEARRVELKRLARLLANETGCHIKTAGQHIAKACRRKRHPNYSGDGGYKAAMAAGWGGPRPGAGRPVIEDERNLE